MWGATEISLSVRGLPEGIYLMQIAHFVSSIYASEFTSLIYNKCFDYNSRKRATIPMRDFELLLGKNCFLVFRLNSNKSFIRMSYLSICF